MATRRKRSPGTYELAVNRMMRLAIIVFIGSWAWIAAKMAIDGSFNGLGAALARLIAHLFGR